MTKPKKTYRSLRLPADTHARIEIAALCLNYQMNCLDGSIGVVMKHTLDKISPKEILSPFKLGYLCGLQIGEKALRRRAPVCRK